MERKRLTIKHQLIFLVPLLTVAVWVAVTFHNLNTVEAAFNRSTINETKVWVGKLSELILDDLKSGGYAKIRRTVKSIVESGVLGFVQVKNVGGETIFLWPEAYDRLKLKPVLPGAHEEIADLQGMKDSDDVSKKYSFDVKDNFGTYWGSLIIKLPQKGYAAAISEQKFRNIFFGLGLLLIELALIILVINRMFHPLELMSNSVKIIADDISNAENHVEQLRCTVQKCNNSEVLSLGKQVLSFVDGLLHFKKENENLSVLAAIGQTTAMVAHDVRRPLASMKSLLSALPAIKDDPAQVKKMVQIVDNNIRQTNAMLDDILDFSRDASVLDLKQHNLESLVKTAEADVLRNHPEAQISFEHDFGHDKTLKVDGQRIVRVITNILDNSFDAMKNDSGISSGKIFVSTSMVEKENGSFVRIVLSDTGKGIPKDVLPKVFDPFFTYNKKGGTGLGLTICQRIVGLHSGAIGVVNPASGTGASFELILPAGEKISAATNEYGGDMKKILLLNDDECFNVGMKIDLKSLGCQVLDATSMSDALKIFYSEKFDAIISDINLGDPSATGYDFLKKVREQDEKIPFIFTSGYSRGDELPKAKSSGATEYLQTPFEMSDLKKALSI